MPAHAHPVIDQGTYALKLFEQHWYLFDPEIAEAEFIEKLHTAQLYRCMRENGRPHLLVVTEPWPNHPTSWFEQWQRILPVAPAVIATPGASSFGGQTHEST